MKGTIKNMVIVGIVMLFLVSCQSSKPWFEQTTPIRNQHPEFAYEEFTNPFTNSYYPLDSAIYLHMVNQGLPEDCAQDRAMSHSELILERKLPNRCHAQFYEFNEVSAVIDQDTLIILFENWSKYRKHSSKILEIKVLEKAYYAELYHWSAKEKEVVGYDGSVNIRPAPTTIWNKTQFKLSQRTFEVGDTLFGQLKFEGIQPKRRHQVKDQVSGIFRVVVQSSDHCFSLASALEE